MNRTKRGGLDARPGTNRPSLTTLVQIGGMWMVVAVCGPAAAIEPSRELHHIVTGMQNAPVQSPVSVLTIRDESGTSHPIEAMATSPDGQFMCVATDDNRLHLIRTDSRETIDVAEAHRDRIRSVAFSPRGDRVASVGNDGRLAVWSIGRGLQPVQTMARTPALAKVVYMPDGRSLLAVGFIDRMYRIGRRHSPGETRRLRCGDMRSVDVSESGEIAVAGRRGTLHLFNRDGRMQVRTLEQGSINAVKFLPGSQRLVTASDDGCVAVYDVATDRILDHIHLDHGRLFALAVLGSDAVAVAGSDDAIRLIDLSGGRVQAELRGHRGSIVSLQNLATGGSSPDTAAQQLVSAGYDGTLRFWNLSPTGPESLMASGDSLER